MIEPFRGDAWTEPAQDEEDEQWFRKHRPAKERVRPATVAEQVWMFEMTGGAVHDDIRITRAFDFSQKGHVYVVYEKNPA